MRFKKKPQCRTIVSGIIIVLLALLSSHTAKIHFLWSGILMVFGIILFSTGFLENRKVPKRIRLFSKKINNR